MVRRRTRRRRRKKKRNGTRMRRRRRREGRRKNRVIRTYVLVDSWSLSSFTLLSNFVLTRIVRENVGSICFTKGLKSRCKKNPAQKTLPRHRICPLNCALFQAYNDSVFWLHYFTNHFFDFSVQAVFSCEAKSYEENMLGKKSRRKSDEKIYTIYLECRKQLSWRSV